MNNKQYIANYIAKNCIYLPKELMFGKLTGTRYSSQYYLANALYDQQFLQVVCEEFYNLVKQQIGHFNIQLTGREWSSIPLLTGIPMFLKMKHDISVHSFLIRKTRKNYGRHNYIEGMPNLNPVLVVDDLCNSQNGFVHCLKVLESQDIQTVPFIFAVLNKYPSDMNPNALDHDRYVGPSHKIISIVNGDDINEFRAVKPNNQ